MGHVGQQPPRQVLRVDSGGTEAPSPGNRRMESTCRRHRVRAFRTTGGIMKLLAYVRSVVVNLLHRSRLDDELEEELRTHMQLRGDDLERSGLSRAEAERQAR